MYRERRTRNMCETFHVLRKKIYGERTKTILSSSDKKFHFLPLFVVLSLLLIIRNERGEGKYVETLGQNDGSWGSRSQRRRSFARVRRFHGVMIILLVFNFKWASQRCASPFVFLMTIEIASCRMPGRAEFSSFSKCCNFREKLEFFHARERERDRPFVTEDHVLKHTCTCDTWNGFIQALKKLCNFLIASAFKAWTAKDFKKETFSLYTCIYI